MILEPFPAPYRGTISRPRRASSPERAHSPFLTPKTKPIIWRIRVSDPLETGEQVKTLPVLIVSLACAGHSFAQVAAPAAGPAEGPLLVAQATSAGGAAQGAGLPATATGGGSTLVAVVAAAVAAGLAASLANGVTTTASHH
jgi:hypothetical protein